MYGRFPVLTLLLLALAGFAHNAVAQSAGGSVKGKVMDGSAPAEQATILLLKGGEPYNGALTAPDGTYSIEDIPPGEYTLKVTYVGTEREIPINISSGITTEVPLIDMQTDVTIEEITVTADKLVESDQTIQGTEINQEQLRLRSNRGYVAAAGQGTAGVVTDPDGGGANIRGGRGENTQVFVDGMRVTGNANLPQVSVESVRIITGGTPPWYGDVTSGIVEITTMNPSNEFRVSGELLSSQLTDPYNYNLAAISATGPIIKNKVLWGGATDSMEVTRLGYFVAGEFSHQQDADPAALGIYQPKSGVMDTISNDPLTPVVENNNLSFVNKTDFLTRDDFENVDRKPNNDRLQASFNGRLDWRAGENSSVKFGAQYRVFRGDIWETGGRRGHSNSLYAPENNAYQETDNYRFYVRYNQIVPMDYEKKNQRILKSLSYNLQAEVGRVEGRLMNREHQHDVFKYGHVGQFAINDATSALGARDVEAFTLVQPGDANHNPEYTSDAYWITAGFADTSYVFNGENSSNPGLAAYNNSINRFLQENPQPFFNPNFFNDFLDERTNPTDINQLVNFGGVINGQLPQNAYSLYTMPGVTYGRYNLSRNDIVRFTGYANLTLGPKKLAQDDDQNSGGGVFDGTHQFRVGFEFDQRIERSYGLNTRGLWSIMRNLANRHIRDLDPDSETPVYAVDPVTGQSYFQDTVRLSRGFQADLQSGFDRRLRERLRERGMDVDSTDVINTDFLLPEMYDLELFDANELFNNGAALVSYFGYDYTGGIQESVAAEDFFTDTENRPMDAFRPTYIAGYIQDKFELENIYFTLGLRVDRLDLNQSVPVDPYVLVPAWNAGEAAERGGFELPELVSSDWTPYVTRKSNANEAPLGREEILGYRDGDVWYDANGTLVDPELLKVDGEVIPYIRQDSIGIESFEDYQPQVNFLPRLAFSFALSGESNFFAHYDVLTQRPTGAEILNFYDYMFVEQNATLAMANPALTPQQTIDYEVGFQQALDPQGETALTISAYYREMRDMIQFFRYQNAYPITYDTYENIDFGTSKGFAATFETSPNRLVSMTTAYTLQFAEGTGSSLNSARNAIVGIEGLAILRNLQPLDFDQRHTISGNLTVNFNERILNRPQYKSILPANSTLRKILVNSSASLTYNLGSGEPFTRNAIPNQAEVAFGINATRLTQGSPNGSRLPFRYNFDLRLDKTFRVYPSTMFSGKDDETDAAATTTKDSKVDRGKGIDLRLYVVFLNLFNFDNIMNVYSYTGQPDNSGFIESQQGQQLIQNQISPEAYIDQFRMKEENPDNFSMPRRIRVGLLFSF